MEFEQQPVSVLYRVGPAIAGKLNKIGIFTIKDLLFHLPFRYEDRTRCVPLGELIPGIHAQVLGSIADVAEASGYRRRSLLVDICDDTGMLTMRMFHYNQPQKEQLQQGTWIRCYGEVRKGPNSMEMVHPEYSVFQNTPSDQQQKTLTPVYRSTEGVTQKNLRGIVSSALKFSNGKLQEIAPEDELRRLKFPDLDAALKYVHAPPADRGIFHPFNHPGYRRLVFEELLAHQVARRWMKRRRRKFQAPEMEPKGDLSRRLRESLEFTPTDSQGAVIRTIIADIRKVEPMVRLVQGDVGSGKTLVAAAAACWVVDSGYQTAIMAPTELLAEQHVQSFRKWFSPLGVEVLLLTGRLSAKERRLTLATMANASSNIVIGTHALFQETVEFKNLGLIVIDEQHRFGVGQRYALRQKGTDQKQVPHQLVMTATPIPRSLAMTFYADLDVSSIRELPPGRQPVRTFAMPHTQRGMVLSKMRKLCARGGQAYWVCPNIDPSETGDVEAVVDAEARIKKAHPELRIGLVHGRMKSAERDKIMARFHKAKLDVLVATTVIEVGVDVPNASLMVIESSERLGLAQLHQLRGRVGRGSEQARCVLLHGTPLGEVAKRRLEVMLETNDGFEISETDMELRGAGDLLGTQQTGSKLFQIAEFPRDIDLIEDVGRAAETVLERHKEFVRPLVQRWMPEAGNYVDV